MTRTVASLTDLRAGRGRPRGRAAVSRLDPRTSYGTAPSTRRRLGRSRSRAPPRWTPPRGETWTPLLPSRRGCGCRPRGVGGWGSRNRKARTRHRGRGSIVSSSDPMHGGALPDEEHIIVCGRILGVRRSALADFGAQNQREHAGKTSVRNGHPRDETWKFVVLRGFWSQPGAHYQASSRVSHSPPQKVGSLSR